MERAFCIFFSLVRLYLSSRYSQMNSVPKLFSCCYADCWTGNHFSTEFGVLTPNHTHSHTLFWGCVSRWFGRALAWHARGQRFDPAILHQKSTVLRRKYGAFLFTEGDGGCIASPAAVSAQLHPEKNMLPRSRPGKSKASESSGGSISHLCLWFGQVWVQRYSTHASYPAGSRW